MCIIIASVFTEPDKKNKNTKQKKANKKKTNKHKNCQIEYVKTYLFISLFKDQNTY